MLPNVLPQPPSGKRPVVTDGPGTISYRSVFFLLLNLTAAADSRSHAQEWTLTPLAGRPRRTRTSVRPTWQPESEHLGSRVTSARELTSRASTGRC